MDNPKFNSRKPNPKKLQKEIQTNIANESQEQLKDY